MKKKKTIMIGNDWYYWDTNLEQWMPENYKFWGQR